MRYKRALRHRYPTAIALSLAIVLGSIWASSAFSDAGNPILGTIQGQIVTNSDGSVTVYVRGQWNWYSHNSDCNVDRGGAGVGIVWNDPTEPGFTVAKGSISAGVGVKALRAGDTVNVVDGMAHPADVGNVAEGYAGPAGQTFNDPTPPALTTASAAAWKGGCGRVPLSATASPGPGAAANPSHKSCGDGTTSCNGHPWGSWGYSMNGGKGYSHTYAKRSDVGTVCVNFYDVHGKNQVVNGAKEIDVDSNGDNSIQTNAFNATEGANCVSFPFIKSTTPVSPAKVGQKIHDTATVAGAGATQQTKLTFHLFGPGDTDCSKGSIFESGPIPVTGNSTGTSADYDTTPPTGKGAGTYQWTVDLTDSSGNLLDTSGCGKEPSVVDKIPTETTTKEALKVTEKITVTATGQASVGATGKTRIRLFKGTCVVGSETNGTVLHDETDDLNGGGAVDITVDVDSPGAYYWFVEYLGDANTLPSNDACTEAFTVTFPT